MQRFSSTSLPATSLLAGLLFAAAAHVAVPQAAASQLPALVRSSHESLRIVGAGDLAFLGRPVYSASLWTSQGRFEGYQPGQPVALSLWYGREFSRAQLLRITGRAWHKLGLGSASQRNAWLAALSKIWLDISPGDNQTAVVLPGRGISFYNQSRLLGEVNDPELGPAFLAIWLDSRTVVNGLRVQLLGAAATHSADSSGLRPLPPAFN